MGRRDVPRTAEEISETDLARNQVRCTWRNRVVGQCDLPRYHDTEEEAVHSGRREAIRRGVSHVVRRPDETPTPADAPPGAGRPAGRTALRPLRR